MADMNETRNANNAAALAKLTVNDGMIARFTAFLKAWHKNAGDKPTPLMLLVGAAFSKNQSVCEAGFVALQLRPNGCSVKQLGIAFDCGPAHNHTRDLVNAGYVKRSAITAPSLERAKYFTLELTKKGEAAIAKVLAAGITEVTPKMKAAAKAGERRKAKNSVAVTVRVKKPKAKPAVIAPAVNDAPVTEPVASEPVTQAALTDLAAHFNN